MNPPEANVPDVQFPIDVQHITRVFGKVVATHDLTLRVERAKTCGFIGLNGAGKTTAIRMMVGLLRPHKGTIRIMGMQQPAQAHAIKEIVGYVPDRPNIYPWMRVEEAIHFVRSFHRRWNNERCTEMQTLFKLDPTRKVKHLSKGQAAKLSLLLAISHDPPVLILDEPTSGLDPLVRDEFLEGVLAVTAQREQTVLFSSHTLAYVQRLADTVAVMHNGRLLMHTPVDQLLDQTKRIRAVMENAQGPHQAPPGLLFQQIRGREWLITVEKFSPELIEFVRTRNRISHLDVEDLSLDDVFKDIVRGQQEADLAKEAI
jgi:ABC-2 type transport system ATP-binding protein